MAKAGHEYQDAQRGVRLQKALAAAGVASRRDCEELIVEGRVRVNGQTVAALPAWVDPAHDRIEVDGQPIARPSKKHDADRVYLAVHKPRRVISTTDDPQGRRTVLDLIDLPHLKHHRLYPVGRLDADSTGLILLTNDGELAQRLTHPSYGVAKQYHVLVAGRVEDADVERLQSGLLLTHGGGRSGKTPEMKRASMSSVKRLGFERDAEGQPRTKLSVRLREGQNREIRRLMARLGFKVRRLKRVAIGPLNIKGLGVGQYRMLEASEVRRLRAAANEDRPD